MDGKPLGLELVAASKACGEQRYEDALAILEKVTATDHVALVEAIGIAEHGANAAHARGQRDVARSLLALALQGYQAFASWATSGAEGMGRMHDVERVRKQLASW